MKPASHLYIIGLLLLVVGGTWLMESRIQGPAPDMDVRPNVVQPTTSFSRPADAIATYERAVRRAPDVVANHIGLAQAHLQYATYHGHEARHIPAAEAAIEKALRLDPDSQHARILHARLLGKLHRFEGALAIAEDLLDESPRSSAALSLQVDALVELGRLEQAVASNDILMAVRPGLPAYARAGYLRELHGDTEGALEAMALAAEAGVTGSLERAWALHEMGSILMADGQFEHAKHVFDAILSERPDFEQARASLAFLDLLDGNYGIAAQNLEAAYATDGRMDHLAVLLEVYSLTGNQEAHDRTVQRMIDAFNEASAVGENVDMEYADFLADEEIRVEDAVVMARRDFERRPDHRHARETYAWALMKAGHADDAVSVITPLVLDAREDAKLLYRAGLIHMAAQAGERATTLLSRAIELGLERESPAAAMHARDLLASR